MNPLQKLNQLGQSVWYDNIEKEMLVPKGTLQLMIENDDLRGVTSNPSIYDKAIRETHHYDEAIKSLKGKVTDSKSIFFELATKDIQMACDLFKPVYESTQKKDGYVSLEVSPNLAFDAVGTIKEAKQLWSKLNRKNAMIKVPATIEGIEAMKHLIAEGININMTLIFSVKRYMRIVDAYIEGLELRVKNGHAIDSVASVASFFISRIDSAVDPLLKETLPQLQGKVAIANAKKAYQYLLKTMERPEFKALQRRGAQPQRLLWASTGTKNPHYSDVLYMDSLIGEHTVNTVPPATYQAFKDHGMPKITIMDEMDQVDALLEDVASAGISLDEITKTLEKDGISQFEKAFSTLLQAIEQRL